jgi:hypothetical protein
MSKTAPSIPTSPLAGMAAPKASFASPVSVLVEVAAEVAYLAMAGLPAKPEVAAEVAAAPEERVVSEKGTEAEAEVAPSSMVQLDWTGRGVPADSSAAVQAATPRAMAMVAPAPVAEAVEEERTNRV